MPDKKKPWQSQILGKGNNIPESYLKKFISLPGKSVVETGRESDDPDEHSLARFLRDEL